MTGRNEMPATGYLQTKNIGFELSTGRVLFEGIAVAVHEGDKIALVGANGVGKSTLLKILSGIIQPTTGEVQGVSKVSYVPQLDLATFSSDSPIQEYISGYYADWWDVLTTLERQWGLGNLDVDRPVRTLSGGELVKLNLAIALTTNPSVLLLDEPTNHLDLPSKEVLRQFLATFPGGFILVTHDPFFIDQTCEQVWELEDQKLHVYGGNYSTFRDSKMQELEALARKRSAAKKSLAKLKAAREREEQRAARSRRTGREMRQDRSMSAIEKGYFANRASRAAGAKTGQFDTQKAQLEEQISALTRQKRRGPIIQVEAGDTSRRGLFTVDSSTLTVQGNPIVEDLNFNVRGGDRLVVTGRNGVGKTSLLRALLGTSDAYQFERGQVRVAENLNVMYLSQRYEIVDPNLSLLDNILQFNPDITYEQARRVLGNMLFKDDLEILKPASTLSGGETARLAFAMAAASSSDILLLDEPTNNLDIETVDQIIDALQDFPGAIIVISHDIDFLDRLGVEGAYSIKRKRLVKMKHLPAEREAFYQELLILAA